MNNDKKMIIGLIAVFVLILGCVVCMAPNTQNQNQTAYEIPLKTQAFNFFDMDIPIDSNFTLKSNHSDAAKGLLSWQNKGNFSDDVDVIIISKNYTDNLIPDKMKLVSSNGTQKVYMSENYDGNYYRIVKTVNDTDITVCGHNLNLLGKMVNTTKVKDTSKLLAGPVVKNDTTKNNTTTVENKTVENNTTTAENNTTSVENTTPPVVEEKTPFQEVVEKTVETRQNAEQPAEEETPVQEIIEQRAEERIEQQEAPAVETTSQIDPLMIGGGSFTTGSADEDKTYASIYVGADHAGEDVGIKIFYSRDGVALNHGNYVTATIKSDGYIYIASADAYSKYPDFASIELYDASGNLVATQGVHLETTSGTQYF